jgi:hypothetical protein
MKTPHKPLSRKRMHAQIETFQATLGYAVAMARPSGIAGTNPYNVAKVESRLSLVG